MKYQRPVQIFKAHPVYGWILTPNSQIHVPFRNNVIQTINADGHRRVPFSPSNENIKARIALYGCSITYGTGLTDEETYPALLQKSLSEIQIKNKGVGGNSTVQNYLHFREDIKTNRVDIAVFCVYSYHRYRNVPHPTLMKIFLTSDWARIGVEHVPHVHLDRNGEAYIDYTPLWQSSLIRNDFVTFLPDEYFLDLASIAVFHEILGLARNKNIPVIFALLDQGNLYFNELMLKEFDESIDISIPFNKNFTFLPIDIHPTPHANRLFSERLLPVLKNNLTQFLNR